MNLKVADEATQWARTIVARNGGEIPDWTVYKKYVKEKTGSTYGASVPVPREYHYAYLRLKGLSHGDALERLGLADRSSASASAAKPRPWWQFW